MKKLVAAAVLAAFAFSGVPQAQSTWGLWEAERSWIGLGDGAADDWFSLWDGGVGTFNGTDLGTFNVGDNYQIWNWDIKTWGANAGGAALWVTTYETGNRPGEPVFEEWWQSNNETITAEDQIWRGYVEDGDQGGDALQINILDGLAEGDYTVEVYVRAWGTDPEERFDSNDGNNFAATFEVIPEPGTMGLLAIGLLGIVGLRRRMK